MDSRSAYEVPQSPFPALARAVILIETIAGVAVALFLDTGWAAGEGWFRFAPAFAMAAAAAASLIVVRISLAGAAAQTAARGDSLDQASKSLHAIAFAFGTAPATYGLVNAVITSEWWISIVFGAFAMLAQALFFAQVQAELAALRIKQQTGASI